MFFSSLHFFSSILFFSFLIFFFVVLPCFCTGSCCTVLVLDVLGTCSVVLKRSVILACLRFFSSLTPVLEVSGFLFSCIFNLTGVLSFLNIGASDVFGPSCSVSVVLSGLGLGLGLGGGGRW